MKKFAAELFGTFIMVFAGTGAMVTNDMSGGAAGGTSIRGFTLA